MIHCDMSDWDSPRPRIRNSKGNLEFSPGRVRFWYSENEISVIIEDGNGKDIPLVEVEIPINMLRAVIAVAEIDKRDP